MLAYHYLEERKHGREPKVKSHQDRGLKKFHWKPSLCRKKSSNSP
jgi:hypothetical protein